MATAKGKIPIGAEVPVELKEQLDKRAKLENRSKSQVIESAVEFYLEFAEVYEKPSPRPKDAKGRSHAT